MAASSSNDSPSNQPVEGSSNVADGRGAATDEGASTAAAAASSSSTLLKEPPTKPAPKAPTYRDSQNSEHYLTAKAFLQSGDFEEALSTIELGFVATKAQLSTVLGAENVEDVAAVHESMAPLHYLYATTLLYQIEESSSESAMTTMTAPPPAASSSDNGSDDSNPPSVNETHAEDIEIAWENFETARMIMESMLTSNGTAEDMEQIKLDLAQVCLREADLEKLNGRYSDATRDYTDSLKYLEESGSDKIGPYDRKIADVHYNLSLVYMLQVAETKAAGDEQGDSGGVAAAAAGPQAPAAVDEKRVAFLRSRGFHHAFVCGRTLCGQIAFLCGADPDEFLSKAELDVPNFKTTGEEDTVAGDDVDHPQIASLKLKSLRKHVATLQPLEEQTDKVQDLLELLAEIQETIDEAERSEEGVHQVSAMKAEISAAVSAQTGPDQEDSATATNAFGASTASVAASTVAAQPVMAVRKKKKRDADDAKLPAADVETKKANLKEE